MFLICFRVFGGCFFTVVVSGDGLDVALLFHCLEACYSLLFVGGLEVLFVGGLLFLCYLSFVIFVAVSFRLHSQDSAAA